MDTDDVRVTISDLTNAQARMEERINALFKGLDDQKALTDSVWNLALSLRDLANQHKTTAEAVARLRTDMDEIQRKPSRRWDAAQIAVISSIVSCLVGYLLAKLL